MQVNVIREKIINIKEEDLKGKLHLYFVEKSNKNQYFSYFPELKINILKDIKQMTLETLSSRIFTQDQVEYNPDISQSGTLEFSSIDGLADIREVMQLLSYDRASKDLGLLNPKKVTFYSMEFIFGEEEKLFIFRRVNKLSRIRKSGLFGQFKGNEFEKISHNFFGIDADFDVLVYNNEALIINRIALERIFNMNDYFITKTNSAMEVIKEQDRITNFETFKEDCLSDARITRKITKLVNETRLPKFFENFEGIQEIVALFDLQVNINEEGKINYEGTKEELFQITNLMSDAYYESLLLKRKGVDPS